jgi:Uncharacterized conserved protein (DUF2203)
VSEEPDPAGGPRHYSVEQANALLPRLIEVLATLRSASARLGDREARAVLGEAAPGNGGGAAGRTVSEGFLDLRAAVLELREHGILLRDLERGLLDFPALREGREVYLCWQEGEGEVAFWHEPDAGFAGRRPLTDG